MTTKDKVTEIFCIIDEFDKNLNAELAKNLQLPSHDGNAKRCRNRKGRLSENGTIAILPCNDTEKNITFCLTPTNVDGMDERV